MIEKFVAKFKEFAEKEELKTLSDTAKVQLFEIFIKTCGQDKPSGIKKPVQKVETNQSRTIRRPNRAATVKQVSFLKRLIAEGRLDSNTDIDNITVAEASALINEGVSTPKPVPQGTFSGAYSHESDGLESEGDFWESE